MSTALKEILANAGTQGAYWACGIATLCLGTLPHALPPSPEDRTEYEPAFVKSILDADAVPPEAMIGNIDELTHEDRTEGRQVRDALVKMLAAWDALPIGSHKTREVNNWLCSDQWIGAVDAARAVLSPPERDAVVGDWQPMETVR